MTARLAGAPVVARLLERWRAAKAERGLRSELGMTALCLALGFWLRARGFLYDAPAMALDECSWGMMLMDLPLTELLIRPPGFMAISKALASLFGPTETALRTLPWLAGVGALALAPFLARRLFTGAAARLLFVALISLHSGVADLAKEFKPYSVSLLLHMSLVHFALAYLSDRRGRDLAWLLGLSAGGILFAQDLVFAYPSVFALVGWTALRSDRRRVPAIVGTAVVIVAALLLQYFLIWRNLPKDEAAYWGEKYDVFFVPGTGGSYFGWLFDRYLGLALLPGHQRKYWNPTWLADDALAELVDAIGTVWLVLHVAGLFSAALRRRFRQLVLLGSPLVVLIVFNRIGFWPFGVFRTNTFLVVHLGAIAAAALDGNFRRKRPLWDLVPASLLVVLPLLLLEKDWPPPTKRGFTRTSEFPDLLAWLAQREPKPPSLARQVVVLTHGTCEPWDFFLKYHPRTKHLQKPIEDRFEARCIEDPEAALGELRRAIASTARPAWMVRGRNPPFGRQDYLERVQSQRFDRHIIVEWDAKTQTERRRKKR